MRTIAVVLLPQVHRDATTDVSCATQRGHPSRLAR